MGDDRAMKAARGSRRLEELLDLGGDFSPPRKLKARAGYTSREPGQLESEMKSIA